MHKQAALNKTQLKLVNMAERLSKKNYKKNVTSITTVLKTEDGNVYTGVNVKYRSVWKCICAEKVAISKAIEADDPLLDTLVSVKYSPKNNSYSIVNMCGECLQIAIFYKNLKVIINHGGKLKVLPIKRILPFPYL